MPYLNAQVRPFHAWLCLAGFVLASVATALVLATLIASLTYHPELWTGRWLEIALLVALMLAIDLFWFALWRIYRRIARANQAKGSVRS